MAYKVKIQKDGDRPYTPRKLFETILDAQDYAFGVDDGDYGELVYYIYDEDGNEVDAGAIG